MAQRLLPRARRYAGAGLAQNAKRRMLAAPNIRQ